MGVRASLVLCDECSSVVLDYWIDKDTHKLWHIETEGRPANDRVEFTPLGTVILDAEE